MKNRVIVDGGTMSANILAKKLNKDIFSKNKNNVNKR